MCDDLSFLATEIARARQSGKELPTASALPIAKGYAAAERLPDQLGEVSGWKVGATNAGAQKALGTAEPIYGRIFAGGLWRNGAALSIPGERPAEAEPEILLLVGRDPAGEFGDDDIEAVHIGIEVNRPSRDDAFALGAGFIVADNAANIGLVIGPAIPISALQRPEEINVTLLHNGEGLHQGHAATVLGNPIEAARWLVQNRSGTSRPVRRGDWIATGAMTRSVPLALGDEVTADFGTLGKVTASRPDADKL